jgi:hypothetical protein
MVPENNNALIRAETERLAPRNSEPSTSTEV